MIYIFKKLKKFHYKIIKPKQTSSIQETKSPQIKRNC